jgi:hypothetical protein
MYEKFFGLAHAPFSLSADPGFLRLRLLRRQVVESSLLPGSW